MDETKFYGRDLEQHLIRVRADAVLDGGKSGVAIIGPPGIGKTTLLRWAAGHCSASGMLVAYLRVPLYGGAPPLYPLPTILHALSDGLRAHASPEPTALTAAVGVLDSSAMQQRHISGAEFAAALDAAAASAPLAVLIDDFHALEEVRAAALLGLLRSLESACLFVATTRPAATMEALLTPSGDLPIRALRLEGLDLEAAAKLCRTEGHALSDADVAMLTELTDGNPLFLQEAATALNADSSGTSRLPDSMISLLEDRFASLPENARALFLFLALAARPVPLSSLPNVPQLRDATEHLRQLEDARLVSYEVEGSLTVQVRHPHFAGLLVGKTPVVTRSYAHDAVVAFLRQERESSPVSWSEIAHHALRAASPQDLLVLLREAAHEAERCGAASEAARWYRHIQRDAGATAVERKSALVREAVATIAFDPAHAVQLFDRALVTQWDPEDVSVLRLGRARANRFLGNFQEALGDLEMARKLAPPSQAPDIDHQVAVLHGLLGNVDSASVLLERLVLEQAARPVEPKALGHLGQVRYVKGSLRHARDSWQLALALMPDPEYARYLETNLAWASWLLGDDDGSSTLAAATAEASLRAGDLWNLTAIQSIRSHIAAELKDPVAVGLAVDSRTLAERLRSTAAILTAKTALIAALSATGRPAHAVQVAVEVTTAIGKEAEPRELPFVFKTACDAAIMARDTISAAHFWQLGTATVDKSPVWRLPLLRARAELDLLEGHPRRALKVLASLIDEPDWIAHERRRALRVLAGAAEAAAAVSTRAATQLGALGPHPVLQGDAGQAIQRSPQGVKRGRPSRAGPFGLTARELETLRLLAEGRTNASIAARLFVSEGTVRKHVERLLQKLRCKRRGELIAFAHRVGLMGETGAASGKQT